jgi:alpha-D-ribose 1-methylphosphonate 5-phosphate C-P lyase
MNLREWLDQRRKGQVQTAKYAYAFLDEGAKREIRRTILKAVAIPGYQAPFGSREMPIARGWGTGGLQVTLSILGESDTLKVIDQGSDDSVNAVSLRQFIASVSGVKTTTVTAEASVIQTRHRVPEEPLRSDQILVLQVPIPEPLRHVESSEAQTRRMHAEADYSRMWLHLYEDIVKYREITIGSRYPLLVNRRYVMDPSPIPRWDCPALHRSETLYLFGAGREKRIYAVPPHTDVEPLEFEDHAFRVEDFRGVQCALCGSEDTYLDEIVEDEGGRRVHVCSDSAYCTARRPAREEVPV